ENDNGTITITGLKVTDDDSNAAKGTFTFTDSSQSGAAVWPKIESGLLSDINSALKDGGITYTPGSSAPQTDQITLTVIDSHKHSDTVHFVFNESGTGPNVTLSGTDGKDVIFATGYNDTMSGGKGNDQFVFGPSSHANQDTITNFSPGQDLIDLRAFGATI